jgi:hypothetical protein
MPPYCVSGFWYAYIYPNTNEQKKLLNKDKVELFISKVKGIAGINIHGPIYYVICFTCVCWCPMKKM